MEKIRLGTIQRHGLNIAPISAFKDNYIWCLHNQKFAAIIDPGDAQPALDYLTQYNLDLDAILITHYHNDHIGGLVQLKQRYPNVKIYSSIKENISLATNYLSNNDTLILSNLDEICFETIEVVGHTKGHLAFFSEKFGILFSGDTLFAGGCGRVFEGSYDEMHNSLVKLANLPDDTLIFCAHEYTLSNLKFALAVEPHNQDILQRINSEQKKLADGYPTIPSTIQIEKATNPFLRCDQSDIQEIASNIC